MKYERKRKIKREDLGRTIEKIGKGLREKGTIEIYDLKIPIPNDVTLEVEYKEKYRKRKVELEVKWYVEEEDGHSPFIIKPQTHVKIADISELQPGNSVEFDYAGLPSILVCLGDKEMYAYSAFCPHEGEIIEWDKSQGFLICREHNAAFDSRTGMPVKGPADEKLRGILIEIRGDEVFAIGTVR